MMYRFANGLLASNSCAETFNMNLGTDGHRPQVFVI